jgi:hypothetical protein
MPLWLYYLFLLCSLLSPNKVRQVASRSEYGCEEINKYSSYELNQTFLFTVSFPLFVILLPISHSVLRQFYKQEGTLNTAFNLNAGRKRAIVEK